MRTYLRRPTRLITAALVGIVAVLAPLGRERAYADGPTITGIVVNEANTRLAKC